MKTKAGILFFVASLLVNQLAFAGTAEDDDAKWIAQCITDSKGSGQTDEVILKYCSCMNDKMSDNETQSISQWEKTHPKEEKECDAKAGWK